MIENLKEQMMCTVERLQESSRAWPFLKPVSREEAPNYHLIVSNPMDLSTRESNVNAGKYNSMDHFVRAARLIFLNCYRYNADDSVYSRSEKELKEFFNNEVEGWKDSLPQWSNE
jgi:histone acetyltransferase